MKYTLLTLLLIFLSLLSCKKKEIEFDFSGNVKANNTGLNLSGVDIKIYTYSLGNQVESLKGQTQTDAAGNYELTIERSKFEKLLIVVSKHNYFTQEITYSFDDLSPDNTNEFNYSLSPKSWTRFILQNNFSNETNDELKIQKVSGKTDCEECCANGLSYYHGIVDTVVVCANDGDTYMKFYWWVNEVEQTGEDSVYNVPFDTLDYSIIY